jgi:cytochrome bd-type quinol oxidase subunit 1
MRPRAIPNNLGPTLLIALGVLLVPLGIGLPLLLLALAQVRTWQGQRAWPQLHRGLQRLLAPWRRPSRSASLP